MSFLLRFRPEVVADLEAGCTWYEARSPGLGAAFIAACRDALVRIQRNPERVAADADGIRSVRLRRFPYLIHFRIEGETLVVFAIMFGGRDPAAWQARL